MSERTAIFRELTDAEIVDAQQHGLAIAERIIKELRGADAEVALTAMGCLLSCLEEDYYSEGDNRESIRAELLAMICERSDYCHAVPYVPKDH